MSSAVTLPHKHALHLLYHELRPGGSAYSYVMSTDRFADHLQLLKQVNANTAGTLGKITFDDGHHSNYEFALPLLQEHGMQAHFFITVGWTGTLAGYMSWNEVRELHREGQVIGAHGWSHKLLTHCDAKDLQQELERPRNQLEEKLGVPITTMSLPGGRYNRRVLQACREAGYTHVYTSHPRLEQEPLGEKVGRLNVRGNMADAELASLLRQNSGTLRRLEREDRIKSLMKRGLGDTAYAKIWALLNRQKHDIDVTGKLEK